MKWFVTESNTLGELRRTKGEFTELEKKYNDLVDKSDKNHGKYEKDVHDLRSQISKLTKEADSHKKESKKCKGKNHFCFLGSPPQFSSRS